MYNLNLIIVLIRIRSLYYVSRSKMKDHETQIVKGNYSSKITYIVRLILKLQSQSKDVEEQQNLKILIFSQWMPILQAISSALKENDITFRLQCTPQSLEDFKVNERYTYLSKVEDQTL